MARTSADRDQLDMSSNGSTSTSTSVHTLAGGARIACGDFCSVTLWRCDQLLRLSSAPGLFRALGLFGDEAVDGVGGAYEDSVVT